MELVELQGSLAEFQKRGIRIVALSVDGPDDLARMRDSAGAELEFVSDRDAQLIDLFGVRHGGGRIDGADIAQSASFLLDSAGRLVWKRVAENYRVRPRSREILEAADRLLGTAPGS